jgi:putative Mn2+ efflux pump MntP
MVWQGAIGRSTYIEKLDKTFDQKKLFHIAVVTNIDTLVLGAGFSFMGSGALTALALFLIFGFIAVYTALTIGYNLGASYQRQVFMSGGVLMIIFAVWVLVEYL